MIMKHALIALLTCLCSLNAWATQPSKSPAATAFGSAQWIGEAVAIDDSTHAGARPIVVGRSLHWDKTVLKATIHICGLGQYELYLDHRKVGEDLFTPAWSDYTKTVFYNVYDVTPQLSARHDLRIDVLLGNGFYCERGLRYHKLKSAYGPLTLLFRLDILFTDGTRLDLVSDGSWQWRLSAVTYSSLYGGEDHDFRLLSPEARPAFHPVVVQPAPKGTLREQIALPVREYRRYNVAGRPMKGVFDMGQNLAGYPELRLRGRKGQHVRVLVGETLNERGVSQKQTGKPSYFDLTLDDGDNLFRPHFSYTGFQYVEVQGAVTPDEANPDSLPVIESLQSVFISNAAATQGSFACSSERLNNTVRLIDMAVRSNFQNVWTDCPHREKLGWLEQDWLNGPGLVYTYDCRDFIRQTMRLIADAQHADGSMPEIAPEYIHFEGSWAPPFQESPEWGGALVALPFLYMDHYADSSLVKEYYPNMKRYVDYLTTRDSSRTINFGLGDWYDYGPWRAGFARNTSVKFVATVHYYRWALLTSRAAAICGDRPSNRRYARLAREIAQAIVRDFYHPDRHTFDTGSQAANAMALCLNLAPKKHRKKVLQSLVADIHSHGNRLTTGDVGSPYLYDALARNGQGDLLYTLFDHDSLPGYGYQIAQGMTTLTEQWDPKQGASRNHFMLGHLNNLLIPYVAGLRISGDRVVIDPHPIGNLTWVKASAQALGGRVTVEWRIENGTFVLNITAPKSTQLKLQLNEEEISRRCGTRELHLRYSLSRQ
jgi:alpha-L-rhamnosidase